MSTVPSARHRVILAGLTFVLVLIVGYGADVVLIQHPGWIFVDDVILAASAALVVFLYERERSRILSERLRVIRDMNSFVRNELQILYACLHGQEQVHVSTAERSVERIDWALRELLPGGQPLAGIQTEDHTARPESQIRKSA